MLLLAGVGTRVAPSLPAKDLSPANRQQEERFFETRIRPILHEHCYSCHSEDAKIVRGGLYVDSREGLQRGGDSGPAVVPGDAAASLFSDAVKYESLEMPPKGKLPEAVIDDLVDWIERGAFDPRTEPRRSDAAETGHGLDSPASQTHWSFQPVALPQVPDTTDAWIQSPIDAFVLQKLQTRNWQPATAADKYTLLRRATFDLTGLPPTSAEIANFLADDSSNSFARVVDRLLASSAYGERWGRHWLDLVRYADTNGADENHKMPNAWRYRDWVFEMHNRDLPLDQFITHQLAGDLLDESTKQLDPETHERRVRDRLTATGMLVIGPKMLAEQDKAKMQIDIIDEQIDTVSRTMLGMTVACARCHDHKFDPISAPDYYALAGIFASTRTMKNQNFVSEWMERDLPSQRTAELRTAHQQKIDAAQQSLDQQIAAANDALLSAADVDKLPEKPETKYPEATKQAIEKAREQLKTLTEAMPAFDSAMAVEEGTPTNLPVHLRGNHLSPAEKETPRGVPARLNQVVALPPIPTDESGRLQLARWLTDADHPLTGRVMANRVWMWHFGQPLMRSPSNFGLQSDPPLHRELLDWLTRRLIDDGWSLKRMHRLIMLSSTYQMNSLPGPHEEADPENEFLSRQNRRRLEVEPLRDAIHVAGDSLDRRLGGPPVGSEQPRRTVYLTINRAALLDLLSTFDYVETANHIEQRSVTTVPNQALFLMNSSLVHQQAERLAKQLLDAELNDVQRIEQLWLKLHGRPASEQEVELSLKFIADGMLHLPNESGPQAVWASLCRTLIAGSAFSYVD